MLPHGLRHPARIVPLLFFIAILAGTALLMLPVARNGSGGAPFAVALFTATSAVCVTGLNVVDTAQYWSVAGQAIILALFQVGGFGLMTGATLLGLLITRRVGLGRRLALQQELPVVNAGTVAEVLRMVLRVTLAVEALVAAGLAIRLHGAWGESWHQALWHGAFHAISAFNNAGFSTYSDSLMRFAGDPLILVPVALAIVVGGLGFPVLHELMAMRRPPSRWSLQTRMTLTGSAILLLIGFVSCAAYEWNNPATLGPLAPGARLLNALFHAVTVRTAGFNAIDVGGLHPDTLAVTDLLMFIGAGSASTAGGIKVTTFFLLAWVVWAEVRGDSDTNAFGRRVSLAVQRQALTVFLLMLAFTGLGTLALLSVSDFSLSQVLFEVISALATVGLSTGITAKLPVDGQMVIVALMYLGRVGPVTVATALALRRGRQRYRYPQEDPIVG